MKAKDVLLTIGDKQIKLGSLSNNKKCALIIQLLNERNSLKEQISSNNANTAKIG